MADLVRVPVTHTAQAAGAAAGRRIGPAISARVYEILRPREASDQGDEIVGLPVGGGGPSGK